MVTWCKILSFEYIEGGHLETIAEPHGITGIVADNCSIYSRSQILVMTTPSIMWHMRKLMCIHRAIRGSMCMVEQL